MPLPVGISFTSETISNMTTRSPKDTAIEWFNRVWAQGSEEAIAELMTESAVVHQEGGVDVRGPAEFLEFHRQMFAALPDLTLRILRAVGDDRLAAIHWEAAGTQRGNFFGIAATNLPVRIIGMSFVVAEGGRLAEGWDCWDFGTLKASLVN